jgi:hypothetical protein
MRTRAPETCGGCAVSECSSAAEAAVDKSRAVLFSSTNFGTSERWREGMSFAEAADPTDERSRQTEKAQKEIVS